MPQPPANEPAPARYRMMLPQPVPAGARALVDADGQITGFEWGAMPPGLARALADEIAPEGMERRVAALEREVELLLRTALAKADVTVNDIRAAHGLPAFDLPPAVPDGQPDGR